MTGAGDLFLLQELAEASGKRGLPLGIVTFQHMAFDDYAVGASSKRQARMGQDTGQVRGDSVLQHAGTDPTHSGQDAEEQCIRA